MSLDPKEWRLAHPDLFITHYFGHRIKQLEDFHLRLVDTATTQENGLILYPAGHGKTTLVSTLLPIWAICCNPNVQVAVIGKNEDEAKNKIARAVIAELMSNDRLIEDFGPFQPTDPNKSWSLTNLTIEGRTSREKEPTIAFFGSGSKGTLGHRAHWIICDDVVTDKNSGSPTQRETVREWFNQSVDTMALPGGRLTVVGTLFDPEDLYNDLILMVDPDSGEPIWHVQREDAIVDEEEHITLWPDFWPWKRLMKKKASMGTLDFNKRYRNIAVDKSRQVFKEEYIKGGYIGETRFPGCLDRDYVVGDFDPGWPRYIGFDPATGGTRHAKFCAHITLAVGACRDHEKCLWVVDILRNQMSLIQQVDLILSQHEKYGAMTSMVEANSYQQGLLDAIKARMDDTGTAFRIEPHVTNRVNKVDPELGVQSMVPWFENGKVHIPQGNPESLGKMKQFVDELIEYPGRTTDTVMAFWFAWRAATEGGPRYTSYNRLRKPETFWGRKAMGRRVVKNPYYADRGVSEGA
jgi:hypothetical protein